MGILDSIRLLYCLNESGVDKAHELLEGLLHDQGMQQITQEQLREEIAQSNQNVITEMQKTEEKQNIRRVRIREQHLEEFEILGYQKAFCEQREMLKAIRDCEDDPYFWTVDAYNWGYIQGIRAERVRRKKVSV